MSDYDISPETLDSMAAILVCANLGGVNKPGAFAMACDAINAMASAFEVGEDVADAAKLRFQRRIPR